MKFLIAISLFCSVISQSTSDAAVVTATIASTVQQTTASAAAPAQTTLEKTTAAATETPRVVIITKTNTDGIVVIATSLIPARTSPTSAAVANSSSSVSSTGITIIVVVVVVAVIAAGIAIYAFRSFGLKPSDAFKKRLKKKKDEHDTVEDGIGATEMSNADLDTPITFNRPLPRSSPGELAGAGGGYPEYSTVSPTSDEGISPTTYIQAQEQQYLYDNRDYYPQEVEDSYYPQSGQNQQYYPPPTPPKQEQINYPSLSSTSFQQNNKQYDPRSPVIIRKV